MKHITNPFVFNDIVSWLWKRLLCVRGIHLFDGILTEDAEQPYFECDGCGYQVYIVERDPAQYQGIALMGLPVERPQFTVDWGEYDHLEEDAI